MAFVYIDTTFLLIVAFVPAIVMFIAGFLVKHFQMGRIARTIAKAIRNADPLLFLIGADRKMRVIKMEEGITGYWHDRDLEVIPDSKAIYSLYGAPSGIATAQTVSNLGPEFLATAQSLFDAQKKGQLTALQDIAGHSVGTTPEDLGKILYEIHQQKKELEKRIELVNMIQSGQMTILEYEKRENMNIEQARKFEAEWKEDSKDGGKLMHDKLEQIKAASTITVKEDGWTIEQRFNKKTKQSFMTLVRNHLLTLDDFWFLMPTGSDMNSLWTYAQRKSEQDRLERGGDEAKNTRLLILGMTAMMFMIGAGILVYLSTGK